MSGKVAGFFSVRASTDQVISSDFMDLNGISLALRTAEILVKANSIDAVYMVCGEHSLYKKVKEKFPSINWLKKPSFLEGQFVSRHKIMEFFCNEIQADISLQLSTSHPFIESSTLEVAINILKNNVTDFDSVIHCDRNYGLNWTAYAEPLYQLEELPSSLLQQNLHEVRYRETTGLYAIRTNVAKRLKRRVGLNPYFLLAKQIETIATNQSQASKQLAAIVARGLMHNVPAENLGLKELKGSLKGGSITIVGAAPSVLNYDLSKLSNQKVMVLNRAYKLLDNGLGHIDYHLVCDRQMALAYGDEMLLFPCNKRVYYEMVSQYFPDKEDSIVSLPLEVGASMSDGFFQSDLENGISKRINVLLTGLELAYYLGVKQINILGVAFSWNTEGKFYKDATEKDWVTDNQTKYQEQIKRAVVFANNFLNKNDVNVTFISEREIVPGVAYQTFTQFVNE